MQFQTPTTKSEMLATLKEIFHYYRIERQKPEEVTLKPLELPTLNFYEKTEEELTEEARKLVASSHQREKNKSKEEINEKLASVNILIASNNQNTQNLVEKITELYVKSQEKIREEGTIKGFATSNAVLDKISLLEEEKNKKITEAIEKNQQNFAALESQKAELNVRLLALDDFFDTLFEKEVQAKVIELTKEQLKHRENINKYNNSISEKMQNSHNNVLNAQASLELKYLELKMPELSQDTLMELGYYDDVIDCVNGYYSKIGAVQAYEDLLNERSLMVYLDDYYQDLLYAYKLKAKV